MQGEWCYSTLTGSKCVVDIKCMVDIKMPSLLRKLCKMRRQLFFLFVFKRSSKSNIRAQMPQNCFKRIALQ